MVCLRDIQLAIVFAVLLIIARPTPAGAADTATERADRIFLQQLTERGFFSLAEQHCRRLMQQAVSPYESGRWQLRLCETYEKHAWSAVAASRTGLLSRSVEELTEFLQTSVAYPEIDLQARLQLVSALRQNVRMSLIVSEAGHLFGRNQGSFLTWSPDRRAAHAATIERGLRLTQELLLHLDAIRGDVDASLARHIRDQGRLALAELHVLNWRLHAGSGAAKSMLDIAEEATGQSFRTARSPEIKQAAAWLFAELSLYDGDEETFQLRIRAILEAPVSADFLMPEFLTIRSHLFAQNATAAAELTEGTGARSALQKQQLEWLKLESLLGLRELAGQLDDQNLIRSVTDRFGEQRDLIRRSYNGVFRDAAEATVRRFDLVSEVGVEIAGMIEQIEYDRSAGRNADALRLIGVALQRLPTDNQGRARGSLELRAGEILIDNRQWREAEERLEKAVAQFARDKMPAEQAAADLLRIFALAQRVKPGDGTAGVSEEEYIAALQFHLDTFPGETTVETATKWLRKIVAGRDPLKAAELSLKQAADSVSPTRRLTQLEEARRLLQDVRTTQTPDKREQVCRLFGKLVAELVSDRNTYPEADTAALELSAMQYTLRYSADETTDWSSAYAWLQGLRKILQSSNSGLDDNTKSELVLLNAVVSVRGRVSSTQLEDLKLSVRQLPSESLLSAIDFLHSQIEPATPQAGDGWIAETIDSLLRRLLKAPNVALEISDQMWLLSAASVAGNTTGDERNTDQLLDRLLAERLTEEQLKEIVDTLSLGIDNFAPVAGAPVQHRHQAGGRFWRKLLAEKPQGSDMWLEASLQLAMLVARSGDLDAARKQIGIVQTIYPDWGSAGRKNRADEFLKRLADQ